MENKNYLPKGFHYLERDKLILKNSILNSFVKTSNNLFNELVEFPPVAYLDTFKRGANIIGDKIFEFKDKNNRELVLTPDSQAHIFNLYLKNIDTNKNIRYTWISPTFRYRNIPNRHFYQIGYASINYSVQHEIIELFLCVKQLVSFIKNITKNKICISIINPAITLEILNCIYRDEDKTATSLYDKIRNLEPNEIFSILKKTLQESNYKNDLLAIFSNKQCDNSFLDSLEKYSECSSTSHFSKLLSTISDIKIVINIQNLYSSEILSGTGIIIQIEDDKIGDGGIYNIYGKRYDSKINTAISICTGLNALSRHIDNNVVNRTITIFIKEYEKNILETLLLSETLTKLNFVANIQPSTKYNKKYFSSETWLLFIDEADSGFFNGRVSNEINNFFQTFKNCSVEKIISFIANI